MLETEIHQQLPTEAGRKSEPAAEGQSWEVIVVMVTVTQNYQNSSNTLKCMNLRV